MTERITPLHCRFSYSTSRSQPFTLHVLLHSQANLLLSDVESQILIGKSRASAGDANEETEAKRVTKIINELSDVALQEWIDLASPHHT